MKFRNAELRAFAGDNFCDVGIDEDGAEFVRANPQIRTWEGFLMARPGDWIIKGVQGEFYPCKPDIFEATYEAVP